MMKERMLRGHGKWFGALLALGLAVWMLCLPAAAGEAGTEGDWVNFLLLCNEGMSNEGGNVGNTQMVVAMNETTGTIRLMMFTWDSFVKYEGYDVPQKLDMAYRNNGPEETLKVFNANFDMGIVRFMSLNYLNLATLIDSYGGVDVEVSRAERNALNGMVSAKKENLQEMQDSNLLDELFVDMLAQEYYLSEFGPDTHLNGLQAVAFGWLQYDSVYNCCQREVEVIASLFRSVSAALHEEIVFWTDEGEEPEVEDGRRVVNLDHVSDEDMTYLRELISPIFNTSYHNLPEEDIESITLTLARIAYLASREGVDILDQMTCTVFPLEAKEPYDLVAGTEGHLIDYEKNTAEMKAFLYGSDEPKEE